MWKYREFIHPSGELDFKFVPAAHHDKIIEALQFLEYGQDYDGNPVSKVLIMLPPGAAKSTYGSIQFATWYLARNPTHNILAASNTTDLAEGFNRRRRNVLRTAEWTTLAETQIDPNNAGVGRFQLLSGGSMTASGVGSSIVGLRANLLIIDDPIQSFEQAMSSTQLDKIWQWYISDARSRLLPTGKELMITTRWAKNDPAGRILKLIDEGKEHWHVVRLPMLCDDPQTDPLQRQLGDPLWPEWFTDEQIERNQRDPLIWSSQYQQVPLDESGSWVSPEYVQIVDDAPEELNVVVAMDLALSVGKGDYTVFVVAGIDAESRIYILDVIRGRWGPEESVQRLITLNEQYEPSHTLIDDDPAAKVFKRLALKILQDRDYYFGLDSMPLRGHDKETRAAAIRGLFMRRQVFIKQAAWTPNLLSEIYDFPGGAHDDQIDCLSLIGRHAPAMYRPSAKTKEPIQINGVVEKTVMDDDGNEVTRLFIGRDLDTLWADREAMKPRFNRYRV